MMKIALVSALAAVASANIVDDKFHGLFNAWRAEHNKEYATQAEESKALVAFIANHEIIETHNAGDHTYKLGHNEFSDLTFEEFSAQYLGYKRPTETQSREVAYELIEAAKYAPESKDWVAEGAVNAVKNQGQCGSCWAFSATSTIESAVYLKTGKLHSFAEQDLVDCDAGFFSNHGCNGGQMDFAFRHVANNGQCLEDDYPYKAKQGKCNKTCDRSQAKITSYKDVPSANEDALKAAVAQQPVSVALEADKMAFQLYSSGVLTSSACGTQPDHGVVVVGYGTDAGQDYWKVRNSWGDSWGEDGYLRIARNTGGVGICAIAIMPSYPIA